MWSLIVIYAYINIDLGVLELHLVLCRSFDVFPRLRVPFTVNDRSYNDRHNDKYGHYDSDNHGSSAAPGGHKRTSSARLACHYSVFVFTVF